MDQIIWVWYRLWNLYTEYKTDLFVDFGDAFAMLKFREERYAGRYVALSLSEGWMGYAMQYVRDP